MFDRASDTINLDIISLDGILEQLAGVGGGVGAQLKAFNIGEYLYLSLDAKPAIVALGVLVVVTMLSLMVALVLTSERSGESAEAGAALSATGAFFGRLFAGDGMTRTASGPPKRPPPASSRKKPARVPPRRAKKPVDAADGGGKQSALTEIEAEMLALKDLYARDMIPSDVYVSESRALYNRARELG